jgi:diketogulonate reductase-like aldo/keto reductase
MQPDHIQLRTGRWMPLLGFGTYQIPAASAGVDAILSALDARYCLIDCASFYHNEKTVGEAIGQRNRPDLFIVSKVWNDAVAGGPSAVRAACMQSLADLYVLLFSVSSISYLGTASTLICT